jgi:hypothetical protein
MRIVVSLIQFLLDCITLLHHSSTVWLILLSKRGDWYCTKVTDHIPMDKHVIRSWIYIIDTPAKTSIISSAAFVYIGEWPNHVVNFVPLFYVSTEHCTSIIRKTVLEHLLLLLLGCWGIKWWIPMTFCHSHAGKQDVARWAGWIYKGAHKVHLCTWK